VTSIKKKAVAQSRDLFSKKQKHKRVKSMTSNLFNKRWRKIAGGYHISRPVSKEKYEKPGKKRKNQSLSGVFI